MALVMYSVQDQAAGLFTVPVGCVRIVKALYCVLHRFDFCGIFFQMMSGRVIKIETTTEIRLCVTGGLCFFRL